MKLENICNIVRGSSPRPQGDTRYYGGKIPRLMISDVTRDGMYVTPKIDFLTDEGAKKSRPMKKGDLIIAVSGDPGRPCILNVDACIHDGFVGLKGLNTEYYHIEFLYYFLNYFKSKTKKNAVGAIFQNLTTSQIKNITLPNLVKSDQIRIATVLSRAEALIEQRNQSLQLLDELLRGAFLEIYDKREGIKIKLGSVIEIQSGMIDPRLEPYNSMFHVGGANIESNTGNLIGLKTAKEDGLISNKYLFTSDSVLYSKIRPYLNKVATPNFTGICSADIYPIKPKHEKINKHFLSFILRSKQFLLYANKHSDRTSMPKINRDTLVNFETTLPAFEKQYEFSKLAEKVEILRDHYTESLKELQQLYGSLTQRAFKGELNLDFEVDESPIYQETISFNKENQEAETEISKFSKAISIFHHSIPHSGANDGIDNMLRQLDTELKMRGEVQYWSEYVKYRLMDEKFTYQELKDKVTNFPFDKQPLVEEIQKVIIDCLESNPPFLKQVFDHYPIEETDKKTKENPKTLYFVKPDAAKTV